MKRTAYFFIIFTMILSVFACGKEKEDNSGVSADGQTTTTLSDIIPEPIEIPVFEEREITLMAVGDNLMHMGIVHTGKMQDGTYDYSFLYEGIEDFLEVADIKIINQETILGGNELGFSGFPAFNSPTEVGDAIAKAGFNVVLHASNHTADKGISGLKNCISSKTTSLFSNVTISYFEFTYCSGVSESLIKSSLHEIGETRSELNIPNPLISALGKKCKHKFEVPISTTRCTFPK